MDKQTLKQWFSDGMKPTGAQFAQWLDSYWHKNEAISMSAIENLAETLAHMTSSADLLDAVHTLEAAIATKAAIAQLGDANVRFPAELVSPTVVALDNETDNTYTIPTATGAYRIDAANYGIVVVDKTGSTSSREKILIQLPTVNGPDGVAIKLIGKSGTVSHWTGYAAGQLVKVWWEGDDTFELTGAGLLPTISDQRLKGDIIEYDVANESAVISFLDSLLLRIDGENAMEFGQWGFRIHDFIEAVRGSRSIQLKDGENEVLFSQDGDEPITVLKMQGKSVFTADQRATALQQHRKVYCFGAELIPLSERIGTPPSTARLAYNAGDYVSSGYIQAVTENGASTILKLSAYAPSGWDANHEYYRLTSTKDHYFYEDNTVVAGGVDNEDLAQFTTLNLGEGWLLQAGIGTFGGDGQINQPALPYGYSSQQWYMRLFDPLRRVLISKNSQEDSGATKFWHNGVERMRFTGEGVELKGTVNVCPFDQAYYWDHYTVHPITLSGTSSTSLFPMSYSSSINKGNIGYINGSNGFYFNKSSDYLIEFDINFQALSEDFSLIINDYGSHTIHAGERHFSGRLIVNKSGGSYFNIKMQKESAGNATVNFGAVTISFKKL